MEKGDDTARLGWLAATNDNGPVAENGPGTEPAGVDVDAALTRIAEAIGRHIARRHIRERRAANDNEPETEK